jgi:hypothetical protein
MDAPRGAVRARNRYPEESDNYARKYSEDEASENKNVEWCVAYYMRLYLNRYSTCNVAFATLLM